MEKSFHYKCPKGKEFGNNVPPLNYKLNSYWTKLIESESGRGVLSIINNTNNGTWLFYNCEWQNLYGGAETEILSTICTSLGIPRISSVKYGFNSSIIFRTDDYPVKDPFPAINYTGGRIGIASIMNKTTQEQANQILNSYAEPVPHGWNHSNLAEKSIETNKHLINKCKSAFTERFNCNPIYFATPYNRWDSNTTEALKEFGFNYLTDASAIRREGGHPIIWTHLGSKDNKWEDGILKLYTESKMIKDPIYTLWHLDGKGSNYEDICLWNDWADKSFETYIERINHQIEYQFHRRDVRIYKYNRSIYKIKSNYTFKSGMTIEFPFKITSAKLDDKFCLTKDRSIILPKVNMGTHIIVLNFKNSSGFNSINYTHPIVNWSKKFHNSYYNLSLTVETLSSKPIKSTLKIEVQQSPPFKLIGDDIKDFNYHEGLLTIKLRSSWKSTIKIEFYRPNKEKYHFLKLFIFLIIIGTLFAISLVILKNYSNSFSFVQFD